MAVTQPWGLTPWGETHRGLTLWGVIRRVVSIKCLPDPAAPQVRTGPAAAPGPTPAKLAPGNRLLAIGAGRRRPRPRRSRLLAAPGSEFMETMWRPLLLVSAAGKIAAVLLWALPPWRWVAAGCFFLPDLWLAYQVFAPSAQGICPVFTRFETPRPEIWLTIDDGPDERDTPRILDLLDRYSARATFFLIGERAERLPRLVAETVRRGHEIGHHTRPIRWRASGARGLRGWAGSSTAACGPSGRPAASRGGFARRWGSRAPSSDRRCAGGPAVRRLERAQLRHHEPRSGPGGRPGDAGRAAGSDRAAA